MPDWAAHQDISEDLGAYSVGNLRAHLCGTAARAGGGDGPSQAGPGNAPDMQEPGLGERQADLGCSQKKKKPKN